MKKKLLFAVALGATTLLQAVEDYSLRVLTFEDEDVASGFMAMPDTASRWSSLIDANQYGGILLYGSTGYGEPEQIYGWTDGGNTNLCSQLFSGWGSYSFSAGGHAISHYCSSDLTTYGDYNAQLTIYRAGSDSLLTHSGGHNGSDQFCVQYGYHDNSGYSAEQAPYLWFADSVARVIDHMYINNTTYAINVFLNGNGFVSALMDTDWVRVEAYGYVDMAAEEPADTICFYLAQGGNIVMDWAKFDLSPLGAVVKIGFNLTGSCDNGYGFSLPAYFAFDDVAVRYPKNQSTTGFNLISNTSKVTKILRSGQVLIVRDGRVYNMLGQEQ